MKRGETGTYEVTSLGGGSVRAFVPAPLPPVPPLAFDAALQRMLEAAVLAVGRLDGVSTLLPDRSLFLYSYVRKEAVLSSQIEGHNRRFPTCYSSSWTRCRVSCSMT